MLARIGLTTVVVGLLVLTGCTSTSTGTTSKGHPDASPTSEAPPGRVSRSENFLTPLALDIQALVDPLETARPLPIDGEPSGFGEVSIDTTAGCVTLLWKGDLPDAVLSIIEKYREVPLNVVQVPASLIELSEAMDRIDQGIMHDKFFGPDVRLVSGEKDVRKNLVTLVVADHQHVATEEELRVKIEELAGVPVEVRVSRSTEDDGIIWM